MLINLSMYCFINAKSKYNLHLVLPDLLIDNVKIKRENSLKFLGVVIHDNLTRKTHLELVEVRSRFLNSKSLRSIYFALVHPYINLTTLILHGLVETKPF